LAAAAHNTGIGSERRKPQRARGWRTGADLKALTAPAVIFTVVMIAFPFAYTIWLSLHDVAIGSPSRFNGVANYTALFTSDPLFWKGTRITFVLFVLSLVMQLGAGTWIALLLHNSKRLPGALRSLLISPFVMPPVVVGMMWLVILDPSIGAVNFLLEKVGLPPALWLASPTWVIPTVAMIDTWQWTPYVALIVLGGLQSLPPNVFEAAQIDGTSRWRTFWRITLPMLGPTLVTATILRSVDLLRFFDIIYITTQGGPGDASTTLNIYGFRQGFEFFELGYAAAIMVTLSAIVLGAVLTMMRARRRFNY
jgi:multiple sugar transport system permease protein